MKKILGLDLGSASIGWAFIEENNEERRIKKLGVRLIPFSGDENDQFSKGQTITVNKDRTLKRSQRRGNHRYKLRRQALLKILSENKMLPDDTLIRQMAPLALYGLRAKAVEGKLTLIELGRVLLHLNQKRGYKSSRQQSSEEESGKKQSDYLNALKERKELLRERDITIGQYFYEELKKDPHFRVKEKVFPRDCYIDEFNKIWDKQAQFAENAQKLTDDLKEKIANEIIYYQRPLKSKKGLISKCRYEPLHRVAPKSSPLFQLERIWEEALNVSLKNKYNESFAITMEQVRKIVDFLDEHEKLSSTELMKILGLKRTDGWFPNEKIRKTGIQGNTTKCRIMKVMKDAGINRPDLLQFQLTSEPAVKKETGELKDYQLISADFEKEPLYQLWHLLYSLDDPEVLEKILVNKFKLRPDQAAALMKLDFNSAGFGNKSARAIRKILPGLMEGLQYDKAAQKVGYNHSDSITTEENLARELNDKLEPYKKNSLRQPVVEKVLNQLVNLINSIIENEELGRPDEIRIELARELQQSRKDRNDAYNRMNDTEKDHSAIREKLSKEYPGLKVTRKVIEKYKLARQQDFTCMYSGKIMELSGILNGDGIDVDHIIPQSLLFDDSFQNKVIAFRKENADKSNKTAHDYMQSKSEDAYNQYIERVNKLFENGSVTRSKRDRLLMTDKEIPSDFINRQLNETSYISKEAFRLLKEVCRNVNASSGGITNYLRNEWGYNEILKELNFSKLEAAGKVEDGQIKGWSKREDHRHHAIDALITACTTPGLIQKLNRLNSSITREEMLNEIKGLTTEGWQQRKSLVDQYVQTRRPFAPGEVKKAVAQILISLKSGKKVTAPSLNKATNKKTQAPRGALHKEQVYGLVRKYAKSKTPLNGRFNNVDLIASPKEKELVRLRLAQFNNDPKKAFKNLDKDPIWLDKEKTKALTAVTLWENQFVYKYKLDINFKEKDVDFIVDIGIREKVRARFEEFKSTGQKGHALKDIESNPIWLNKEKRIPIRSVRCFTGYSDLIPLHQSKDGYTNGQNNSIKDGKAVDYVVPRNNHHMAIYKTPDGKYADNTVSLWEAVKRKQAGLPVIVNSPASVWDLVMEKGIEDQRLLDNLPDASCQFLMSISQNEMFVFDIEKEKLEELISQKAYDQISHKIYRVQKLGKSASGAIDIFFRHHLETSVDDKKFGGEDLAKKAGILIRASSLSTLLDRNPQKVRTNVMGEILLI